MTLTTPMHSFVSFNAQGSLTSERSSWLKTAYRPRNGAPTRGGEWFLCPFVLMCWEMIQPVPTKAVLQSAKAATLYWNPPTSPCPTFLLEQNLSSKHLAPTGADPGGVDWVASHPPWVCSVHNILCLSTLWFTWTNGHSCKQSVSWDPNQSLRQWTLVLTGIPELLLWVIFLCVTLAVRLSKITASGNELYLGLYSVYSYCVIE